MPCQNWLSFVLVRFPNEKLLEQALAAVLPGVTLEQVGVVRSAEGCSLDLNRASYAVQERIIRMGGDFERRLKVAYSEAFIAKYTRAKRGVPKRRETDKEIIVTVRY